MAFLYKKCLQTPPKIHKYALKFFLCSSKEEETDVRNLAIYKLKNLC